ncbi:MAG: hypothetical protein IPK70_15360 [Flavobacteriales bacterium]|jgi:hypothetical protein|nr:hypothetical protein [Flavobacteriales bacterium]
MTTRSLLLLLLIASHSAQGQLLDSIGHFLQEPPRFVARLDVRGGFISNRSVRFVGVKAGIDHGKRFQYGLGYSLLFPSEARDAQVGNRTVSGFLRMGYAAPYVDYAFYQRGHWEARIPVQLGFGAGSLSYRDAEGRRRTIGRTGLILYEPAMTVQYRFLRYFALGAGWGFRLVIQTGDDLGEKLTAPVYLFGLRVFLGDMWRDVRGAQE